MGARVAIVVALLAAMACAGCGAGKKAAGATTSTSAAQPATAPATTSTPSAATATAPATSSTTTAAGSTSAAIAILPSDAPACALLYARLQRVTSALTASSELIAHSINKKQLSGRIAIEREQLLRSAQLLTQGPVPTPLIPADQRLVAALVAFSADFARAAAPARQGNFQAAVKDMADMPVIQRILAASKTIQNACQGAGA